MKQVLVTGSKGFIGRNLLEAMKVLDGLSVTEFDLGQSRDELKEMLACADVIFHLAGVNRPREEREFKTGNVDLITDMCEMLRMLNRKPKIVLSSSTQVDRDNAYGKSKLAGEETLAGFSREMNSPAVIFRLSNVFGKWCRPNYNSAVATFCYNIARDLPIEISDPANVVQLVYIDDVVNAFLKELDITTSGDLLRYELITPTYSLTLGVIVEAIKSFRKSRETLFLPNLGDQFTTKLYATYLSYLPSDDFGYNLSPKYDNRGSLAELLKSPFFGQLFVSRTRPGITRGNHFHHTKVEKFFVLQGSANIRFRALESNNVIEYRVNGDDYIVMDIPPGYTHSIQNVGEDELVVLFWASEVFDPGKSDTTPLQVIC